MLCDPASLPRDMVYRWFRLTGNLSVAPLAAPVTKHTVTTRYISVYLYTQVLMYAIAIKTYRSTYCTYLVPQIIKKYQTHLQNILFIFIQITSRRL